MAWSHSRQSNGVMISPICSGRSLGCSALHHSHSHKSFMYWKPTTRGQTSYLLYSPSCPTLTYPVFPHPQPLLLLPGLCFLPYQPVHRLRPMSYSKQQICIQPIASTAYDTFSMVGMYMAGRVVVPLLGHGISRPTAPSSQAWWAAPSGALHHQVVG